MSKDEYLITDAPLKALTVFAMPMILGSFFQQVYNMADSIIVGQFVGSSALAAVGACAALTNVFIAWEKPKPKTPRTMLRTKKLSREVDTMVFILPYSLAPK